MLQSVHFPVNKVSLRQILPEKHVETATDKSVDSDYETIFSWTDVWLWSVNFISNKHLSTKLFWPQKRIAFLSIDRVKLLSLTVILQHEL